MSKWCVPKSVYRMLGGLGKDVAELIYWECARKYATERMKDYWLPYFKCSVLPSIKWSTAFVRIRLDDESKLTPNEAYRYVRGGTQYLSERSWFLILK
jgi:hypothetical protein